MTERMHCGARKDGARPWLEGCTRAPADPSWCYCHCALCDRTSVRSGIRAPSLGRNYTDAPAPAPEPEPAPAPAPEPEPEPEPEPATRGEQLAFPW